MIRPKPFEFYLRSTASPPSIDAGILLAVNARESFTKVL